MKTTKTEVIDELWRRGQLKWLLYKHQLPIYDKIREVLNSDNVDLNSYVIDCSRQYGKSFTMFLIAVEDCLRAPSWTNVFIAPLKSQVNEIINGKTFGTIFATCPRELVPVHKDSALIFSNGSRIRLAGTDNKNYENLRGGAANNIFLDEAGFMADLEEGVLPAVEPMTKTTGGKVVYASTPPENLDHDYYEVLRYHDEANLISTYTIWDDKTLTEIQLQKIINQCKGRDTVKFKREFECQRIADSSKQVIPNLTLERQEKLRIGKLKYRTDSLYPFWKKYIIADWGGRDKTAIIFAHYNYKEKKVILEHQLSFDGERVTPKIMAEQIKKSISELNWEGQDITYVCDSNNKLIQQDMNITYKLPFSATNKARLQEMVEKVKDWEFDDRILFGPDAEFILQSVASGHWNKTRDEFARSKIFGHYDHLAALVYLIRNVDEFTDPVPMQFGINQHTHFVNPYFNDNLKQQQQLEQIFNPRRGRSFR